MGYKIDVAIATHLDAVLNSNDNPVKVKYNEVVANQNRISPTPAITYKTAENGQFEDRINNGLLTLNVWGNIEKDEDDAGKLLDYLRASLDQKPFVIDVDGEDVVVNLQNMRADRVDGNKDQLQIIVALDYRSNS